MELVTKKRLHLLAGRSNLALAEEIAQCLEVELGHPNLSEFANGEIHSRLGENVRGADVFIIQTHGATEELSPSGAGYRFNRSESVAVRRMETVVESRTEIEIHTDRDLRAWKVDVISDSGATRSHGGARRDRGGAWIVSWNGEEPWRLPAAAVPAELVLYQLAANRSRSFSGSVFLPGYGFARAHLEIDFVRLELDERIAGGHHVPFLAQPLRDARIDNRLADFRYDNVC